MPLSISIYCYYYVHHVTSDANSHQEKCAYAGNSSDSSRRVLHISGYIWVSCGQIIGRLIKSATSQRCYSRRSDFPPQHLLFPFTFSEMVSFNKFFKSVFLAVVYASIAEAVLGPNTSSQHSTHRSRNVGRALKLETFHPETNYQVFDHDSRGNCWKLILLNYARLLVLASSNLLLSRLFLLMTPQLPS